MEKIQVAILGTDNGHVPYVANALCRDDDFLLVAASISAGYYDKLNKNIFGNVPIYYDDEELLNDFPDVQLAILGRPNGDHAKQFRLCAERGIHVISMKIPTMDLDEYDGMIALMEKHRIAVYLELEMRFHGEVLRIKELIESGAIGKPLSVTALNNSHFPMWYMPWMNNAEQSYGKRVPLYKGAQVFRGGAMTDHPHVFDLFRWIFDCEIAEAYAEAAPNKRTEAEVEDMVYVIGRLENGMIFSIDPSYSGYEKKLFKREVLDTFMHSPKAVEVEMTVHGERGSILCELYGSRPCGIMPEGGAYGVWSGDFSFNYGRSQMLHHMAKIIRKEIPDDTQESFRQYRNVIQSINMSYDSITDEKTEKRK